jgi:hypothetical protein
MVVLCATAAIVVAPYRAGKVRSFWHDGSAKIGIVPQHQPAPLDEFLALPQDYAEFGMRNMGSRFRRPLRPSGTNNKMLD